TDLTARIDNTLDLTSWSRVEFGVWNTQNTVTYDFLIGGADTTPQGRNTTRDGTGTLSAVYAQHTWTPIPSVDLTTGVRANRYDVTAATYIEPRLGAGWQLTPSLRLKAAWGRYHQFVNRVENEDVLQGSRDFWLLADSSLKPNASTHTIAGFLFDRPSWALNVEAYDKTLENATIFSRRYRQAFGVNTGSFFFTGEGRSRGLEFLLERKLGAVTGWASYTLAKSTAQFADVDQGRAFSTSQDQRHELKLFGTMQLRKWELAATGIYGSGRPYTAPISQYQLKLLDGSTQNYINVGDKNGERLPSYQRVDLAVSRMIRTKGLLDWRVGISLYNIANRRNISFRKFDLSTDPMTISDVTQLGFTPSIDIKLTRRGLRDLTGGR
ncbi:MAG: TonB-dependent receptor, partial [Gemmatimonas sp.]